MFEGEDTDDIKRVSFPIYTHGLKLGRYLDEYEL